MVYNRDLSRINFVGKKINRLQKQILKFWEISGKIQKIMRNLEKKPDTLT